MRKDEVVATIVDVLAEFQSMGGRPATQITGNTCPIGDLAEFDSLNGVEATVELSDRLGIDLPGVNAFANESGTKALTVSEVADTICTLAAEKEPSQ